ncbi:glutathione peroxidase [Aeromonas hydrophila]|uniref:glutathione peroxidase n=1 Tax=Aeromonas hydrophila TaxID=644 RepID=UPI000463B783|nr:glutathione peroxidase [Aeromonas hydrophila]KHN56298.1 glutathione peroxidase [Aeromonas hydrophila]MBW3810678.1 glutathione peroxidase [Aeromonas hydrophila]MBW3843402.1 redoxin domain-containing protein [Aeromonas hydrophila]MCO4201117.1 glutathione peroxidase [Aeromonas hydrophila]OFC44979.1 glutathione peroxidase [Aeromonas hydrophila]
MSLPDLILQRLDGTELPLSTLQGQVVLVVNVASRCGFTPQYTGLEALYRELGPRGLVILGFPCDQFGHQEPGDAEEIARFCSLDYPVSFPIMAKCEVNGEQAHPFYQWLKKEKPGLLGLENVKWNFTKFLIDRDGKVVDRFAPTTKPESLQDDILALL